MLFIRIVVHVSVRELCLALIKLPGGERKQVRSARESDTFTK